MMKKTLYTIVLVWLVGWSMPLRATKLIGLHVIDKDYLMVHFRDGEVHYRDDGTGRSAYLGHYFVAGDDTHKGKTNTYFICKGLSLPHGE